MDKRIECPYCGSHISVTMETRGRQYLSFEAANGFECENWRCGASWDKNGDLISRA